VGRRACNWRFFEKETRGKRGRGYGDGKKIKCAGDATFSEIFKDDARTVLRQKEKPAKSRVSSSISKKEGKRGGEKVPALKPPFSLQRARGTTEGRGSRDSSSTEKGGVVMQKKRQNSLKETLHSLM